ncbi:cold shock domain-containing protein E1-like [Lineus longissimus]|uniref:cold shock domain-containing protein E1-like n=1 Tax=Lineus longissimus TaxID=88925 RepID=UPI002B4E0A41
MANPQWKNFQPPAIQDPAILAFQPRSSPQSHYGNSVMQNSGSNNMNNAVRETGFVEKILHSYGFIQCCDREARLFFHFSEYNGNNESMKIGDPVEFQMCYDRKTGKPIACSVVKVNGSVSFELLSDERVTGTVVTEAKAINRRHSLNGIQDGMGRVSYERNGECFFLPFTLEDIENAESNNVKLKTGDNVTFFISTDKRNGTVRARNVKLLQPFKPERYQGVVCSMKDSFGFIERADVVKEIFFHYSEYQGNINELILGDDCEFAVQSRNGKEVATNIVRLAEGTVIFEDISLDRVRGRILKTLKSAHNRRQSDPLAGRIVYETQTGQVEIPYGDKDQTGDFTMHAGDLIEFNIATDRRDKLQRATNIAVIEDTFKVSGEKRETGMIATLKEGYGFIKCIEREGRMFFHFSEMLDPSKEPQLQDEVQFTVVQDPSSPNREIGIRIKYLPKGTLSFQSVSTERFQGFVDKLPANHKSPSKNNKDAEQGLIMFEINGNKQTIPYVPKDIQDLRAVPKYGDRVEFSISESKRNNNKIAINVKLMSRSSMTRHLGFVATIKDAFGFIETAEHDREVFFHFSAFDGEPGDLDVGDEVEYQLTRKTAKVSAEYIRKLNKGTVAPEDVLPGFIEGRIIRPMRIINPDQDEYPGLVQVGFEDDSNPITYQYGITSLTDKKDFLQKGDAVKFQLSVIRSTGKKRATNITAIRKFIRTKVDSVKGQFGFLNYEVEEGKKLFFHMTEVHDGADIQPGDEVEFVVVQNQRNGKYSACSLRKLQERRRPERPERLISRLKSVSDDSMPKLVVIRQPRGPDGTKGFKNERKLWKQS